MNISFVWDNDCLPADVKLNVEDGVLWCLKRLSYPRNLKPAQLVVRLSLDKPQTLVIGVGFNQAGVPVFKSSYSLIRHEGNCGYYDDDQQEPQ